MLKANLKSEKFVFKLVYVICSKYRDNFLHFTTKMQKLFFFLWNATTSLRGNELTRSRMTFHDVLGGFGGVTTTLHFDWLSQYQPTIVYYCLLILLRSFSSWKFPLYEIRVGGNASGTTGKREEIPCVHIPLNSLWLAKKLLTDRMICNFPLLFRTREGSGHTIVMINYPM